MKIESFKPLEDEKQPEYKGNEGWAIVAIGIDKDVILDYDYKFGALCWFVDSDGTEYLPENIDGLPDEPGVYKVNLSVWTTSVHDYDGADNDMGFTVVGEPETLWELDCE